MSFTSPTSIETSISLSSVHLAPGAELFFYDANHRQIGGAFTDESNQPDSIFIAPFLLGNSITIEYVHPVGAIPIPNFIVKSIIHSFKSTWADNPECHNNVVCDPFKDFCNQIRSVCRVIMGHTYKWSNCNTTNIREVWQTASAALINNSRNDFTPYILTAKHVIWDQLEYHWCLLNKSNTWGFVNMNTMIFEFNFQSRTCTPTVGTTDTDQIYRIRGATIIEHTNQKPLGPDLALLKLSKEVPVQADVYYAGWNRKSKDDLPSWSVTGIHHPGGDFKKISKGNLHYSLVYSNYWGVDWYNGITEQGSSGIPLFCNGDKRIIGTLSFGANDNCDDHNEQDRYGRLRDFWSKVKDELSPDDESRETYSGANPATYCRNFIEINGAVWPYSLYNFSRPIVNIQAAEQVNIANKSTTRFIVTEEWVPPSTIMNLNPIYHISSGTEIIIEPTGSNVFETDLGTELILEIKPCISSQGCENETNENNFRKAGNSTLMHQKNENFQIYPNPNNGQFIVKLSKAGDYTIRISDMLGKVIYTSQISNTTEFKIQLSGYATGTYMVQISSSAEQFVGKVVINE